MRTVNDPTPQQPGFVSRLGRALRNLVILALVVGSASAALYAKSVLNSRSYGLSIENGQLVVMKGRLAPMGLEPWQPGDGALAETYAPIALEGNMPVSVTESIYDDRDALDRALFPVLELLAKPRLASEGAKELQQGLNYVKRAQRLAGISEAQRSSLKTMEQDVSYFLARLSLEEAQRQVDVAMTQLRLASGVDAKHSKDANRMLNAVEAPARALNDALKAAVNGTAVPAPVTPDVKDPPASPPPAVPSAPADAAADGGTP